MIIIESTLEGRCSDLRIVFGRLKTTAAYDALILMRSSFSVPRLMHTLTCSPCDGHHFLEIHDGLLREGISVLINSFFSDLQ